MRAKTRRTSPPGAADGPRVTRRPPSGAHPTRYGPGMAATEPAAVIAPEHPSAPPAVGPWRPLRTRIGRESTALQRFRTSRAVASRGPALIEAVASHLIRKTSLTGDEPATPSPATASPEP
jgi:hypothetical protein